MERLYFHIDIIGRKPACRSRMCDGQTAEHGAERASIRSSGCHLASLDNTNCWSQNVLLKRGRIGIFDLNRTNGGGFLSNSLKHSRKRS